MLGKNSADNILKHFFYFSQKIGFNIVQIMFYFLKDHWAHSGHFEKYGLSQGCSLTMYIATNEENW